MEWVTHGFERTRIQPVSIGPDVHIIVGLIHSSRHIHVFGCDSCSPPVDGDGWLATGDGRNTSVMDIQSALLFTLVD